MKKVVAIMLMAFVFSAIVSTSANRCFAGEVDSLIEKLVDKKILSPEEAKQLADETKNEDKKQALEIPEWVGKMKFSGDLRLRHDTQWRDEGDDKYSRNQERFRLRVGFTSKPTETTEVGVRLVSGSGSQNTTNQSADEHASGKNIFIDKAYLTWKPDSYIEITGGKQKNPLFTSSLVWDSDVSPEGISESFNAKISDSVNLFANLGQWFLEELNVKDTDRDVTLLVYQLGSEIKVSDNVGIQIAGTYYDFANLDELGWSSSVLSDDGEFLGYNHKQSQQMIFDNKKKLLNEFGCWEIGAKVKIKKLLPVPVSIFATYLVNEKADMDELVEKGVDPGNSDPTDLLAYGGDDRDNGWLAGVSFGSEKKKGDWNMEYFYQELEDYAFPAVFVDSDFHGGGTNNKGHYVHGIYCLTDNIQAKATGFFTKREDEAKDGKKDEDRIQLDIIVKF
jgi:hypothetical protein